jgi:hypothetical protein
MNNAKLKAILYLIINLGVNGGIIAVVPVEYKAIALLVFNCVQVVLAFIDPAYTIQKLGISKSEYLGQINK